MVAIECITVQTTSKWMRIELDNGSFIRALHLDLIVSATKDPIEEFVLSKRHLVIKKSVEGPGLVKVSTHVNCDTPSEDLLTGHISQTPSGWTKISSGIDNHTCESEAQGDPEDRQPFRVALTPEGLDILLGW